MLKKFIILSLLICSVNCNSDLQKNNVSCEQEEKEKATFNLSKETLKNLEDTWMTLRRSRLFNDSKVTKTAIVETAVKMALKDFEENGELSQLYRLLKVSS